MELVVGNCIADASQLLVARCPQDRSDLEAADLPNWNAVWSVLDARCRNNVLGLPTSCVTLGNSLLWALFLSEFTNSKNYCYDHNLLSTYCCWVLSMCHLI